MCSSAQAQQDRNSGCTTDGQSDGAPASIEGQDTAGQEADQRGAASKAAALEELIELCEGLGRHAVGTGHRAIPGTGPQASVVTLLRWIFYLMSYNYSTEFP